MAFNPTYGTVEYEGCDLRYWSQGIGPLLIMVPGGGGDGKIYNNLFPLLDKHFTIATYDRRQMSSSKVAVKRQLNPDQQARDIIAVMKALGREKTSVFANSGGGLIAFQLAIAHPEVIEDMIIHEAPTTSLLPDATYHLNRTFEIMDLFKEQGIEAAMKYFATEMRGYERSGPLVINEPENVANWFENEFLQFTIWCPDLRPIAQNHVSIAVAAGEGSLDAFYARTTVPQAEILGCPRIVLPGNHTAFDNMPEAFAAALLEGYKSLKETRSKI